MSTPMQPPAMQGLGQPVPRVEDLALVTGRGRYVDDLAPADAAWAWLARSPYPHALIEHIDTTAARAAPGVLAVLTGGDYASDGLGLIPCVSLPATVTSGRWFRTPFAPLAADRVRCVGEAVAIVIAETRVQARDAAERIEIDYTPLPATPSLAAALDPDAPAVWEMCPDNVCFTHELGDPAATAAAIARAPRVIRRRIVNPRLAGNPLEPRGCIGRFDQTDGRYHLVTATQGPHRIRRLLAEHIFHLPESRVHVQTGDVGGGFGTKGNLYPEEALMPWAARRVGRPVRWRSDRSESFLSDFNGRDQIADAELALDGAGRILALRVITHTNLGCRIGPSGGYPPITGSRLLSGVYAIPAMHVVARGMLTHTNTTTTYRGAGRPEAAYLIERLMDIAAREIGIDPVELRRRNLIGPGQMPYRTAVGETYDCGDFPALMEAALAEADWAGFPARRAASQARGRLRGRGLAACIEVSANLDEHMSIAFDASGRATILAGTCPQGQGHETVYRQMLVEWLGLPFDGIAVVHGDTDQVPVGGGTFASRSMTVGGSALRAAAERIIEQGRQLFARSHEAATEDIDFEGGVFRARGGNTSMAIAELARRAHAEGTPLAAAGRFAVRRQNYPNGCQVAEVEVDPETGEVALVRHTAVDDLGRVLNPLLSEGQVQGGIAQGLGQALMEALVHDEYGQLANGSFMDYAMPRARDLPPLNLHTRNTPTDTNPLGVKGAGEVGIVGAAPAIINALIDALAGCGVDDIAMPATAPAVWQALRRCGNRSGDTQAIADTASPGASP
jgi:carbon-monoxide dehydrogenase large subunit